MIRHITLSLFLCVASALSAVDHPLYFVGKQSYLHEVTSETSLKDLRDETKPTLVQFSADWCGPCVQFWPYLYTLNEINPDAYKIVVIDLTDGWGAQEQLEAEGNFQVQGIPFTAVLAPGGKEDPLVVAFSGNARQAFSEYFLRELERKDPKFESKFSARIKTVRKETLIPAYKVYTKAEKTAIANGKTKSEAKQYAIQAVIAQ